jgi:hypothetical protein
MSTTRDPATDQPAPVPPAADEPGAHLAAMRRLHRAGAPSSVIDLMAERYRLGLTKYGAVLHAANGRDHRRDLLEELADAVAYATALGDQRIIDICDTALLSSLFRDWFDR